LAIVHDVKNAALGASGLPVLLNYYFPNIILNTINKVSEVGKQQAQKKLYCVIKKRNKVYITRFVEPAF
jgi:hypothetical protein